MFYYVVASALQVPIDWASLWPSVRSLPEQIRDCLSWSDRIVKKKLATIVAHNNFNNANNSFFISLGNHFNIPHWLDYLNQYNLLDNDLTAIFCFVVYQLISLNNFENNLTAVFGIILMSVYPAYSWSNAEAWNEKWFKTKFHLNNPVLILSIWKN